MGAEADSHTGPSFARELALSGRRGGPVAGLDEAGRGPWAGPVVAAAVVLEPDRAPGGIMDSKRLTPERREDLYDALAGCAAIGVGIAEVDRIDRINILQASLWAMRAAFDALPERPGAALVDGNRSPDLPCACETLVGGDGLSLSIAAASIVAKVTRDRLMAELADDFPGYGWETNRGYGTRQHAEALRRLGVTAHHRRSFAPVREALLRQQA